MGEEIRERKNIYNVTLNMISLSISAVPLIGKYCLSCYYVEHRNKFDVIISVWGE